MRRLWLAVLFVVLAFVPAIASAQPSFPSSVVQCVSQTCRGYVSAGTCSSGAAMCHAGTRPVMLGLERHACNSGSGGEQGWSTFAIYQCVANGAPTGPLGGAPPVIVGGGVASPGGAGTPGTPGGGPTSPPVGLPAGEPGANTPEPLAKPVEYAKPGDVFDQRNHCWKPGGGGATGFPFGVAVAGVAGRGFLVIEQDGVNTFAQRLLPASKQGVVNYVEALPGTIEARSGQMTWSVAENLVQGAIDRANAMNRFHAQALLMNGAEGPGFAMLPESAGAFIGGAFLSGAVMTFASASTAGADSDAVRCK